MAVKHFPVEAGHILTFARAIGDDNPVYRDEEAAVAAGLGGIIAPPTFVVAGAHFDPDYPLRPALGQAVVRVRARGHRGRRPERHRVRVRLAARRRSTPSSTSNTTGRFGPATSSPLHRTTAGHWQKEGRAGRDDDVHRVRHRVPRRRRRRWW